MESSNMRNKHSDLSASSTNNINPDISSSILTKLLQTDSDSPLQVNNDLINPNCKTEKQSPNIKIPTTVMDKEMSKLNPKKRLLRRHLMEKITSKQHINDETRSSTENDEYRDNDSSLADNEAPFGRGKNGRPLTRTPFVPSYMDPKLGPFLCKICGYPASGLHYKVMACEGCKGFFRRSVQKNLKYKCKMDNKCQITSENRTRCQQCRWQICIKVGMDVSSVLNETERKAKNELITANRLKRKMTEATRGSSQPIEAKCSSSRDSMGEFDANSQQPNIVTTSQSVDSSILRLIEQVTRSYKEVFLENASQSKDPMDMSGGGPARCDFTNKVSRFIKMLPGVVDLSPPDQVVFLRSRCLSIICLCTVFTYDQMQQTLTLPSGRKINAESVKRTPQLDPLWRFALKTHNHQLTVSECAILAALSVCFLPTGDDSSYSCSPHLRGPLEPTYSQLLSALAHLNKDQSLRHSKLLITIFSELKEVTSRLFKIQGQLGQQLLFQDEDPTPILAYSTQAMPTVTSHRPLQAKPLSLSLSMSITPTQAPTSIDPSHTMPQPSESLAPPPQPQQSSSSSIFSFSYKH